MTPDAFCRAIAVYPALLRAYTGEPVTLLPDEALALLDLFDAVGAVTATVPVVTNAAKPIRTAWERALNRGTRRTAA